MECKPCCICGKKVEPYSCSHKRCTACIGSKRHEPKMVGFCAYCGAYGTLTKDHIVPKSRGGSRGPENIAWVCRPCNWGKADLLLDEWLLIKQATNTTPKIELDDQGDCYEAATEETVDYIMPPPYSSLSTTISAPASH